MPPKQKLSVLLHEQPELLKLGLKFARHGILQLYRYMLYICNIYMSAIYIYIYIYICYRCICITIIYIYITAIHTYMYIYIYYVSFIYIYILLFQLRVMYTGMIAILIQLKTDFHNMQS